MRGARQLAFWKGMSAAEFRDSDEHELAYAVADILDRWALPGWWWSAWPGGEYRKPITAARLQRMGVRPGFPDYLFMSPPPMGRAHFIELKARSGRLSDVQLAFQAYCRDAVVPHAVVRSVKEAVAVLGEWGVVPLTIGRRS